MKKLYTSYDAIIVGGGHNGLVAAGYLARAKLRVLVLEASAHFGGAAVTEELAPGYQAPAGAHLLEAWPRTIERELKLSKTGFKMAVADMATIALDLGGRHITLHGNPRQDRDGLRGWSIRDADTYAEFRKELTAAANLLAPMLETLPSSALYQGIARMRMRIKSGIAAERLGRIRLRTLMQRLPASIADLVDAKFDTDLLKGALAIEAIEGRAVGPASPGTMFSLIYREAMRMRAGGRRGFPRGGIGGLSRALAAAAERFGAVLQADAMVSEIIVEDGRATGVRLAGGIEIYAPVILSTADPKCTFLDLLGAGHLDAGLATRISHIRMTGTTAKVNLALAGLPAFENLTDRDYGARLLIGPDLSYIETAFTAFKGGDFASDPVMEIVLPSCHDAELAPHGHHIMSVLVHYVPYELKQGWDDTQRQRLLQKVIDTIAFYAPDMAELVVAGQLLAPPDIEQRFGLPGGDWAHGQMMPDQLMMFRPAPGLANYETPIPGLYFGGAGAHPGGGITGWPGKAAALAALRNRDARTVNARKKRRGTDS